MLKAGFFALLIDRRLATADKLSVVFSGQVNLVLAKAKVPDHSRS